MTKTEGIMELVEEYGRYQKDFGAVEATFAVRRQHYVDVAESYAAIKAAIEELAKDAARYRWLKESDSLENPSVNLALCFRLYTGSLLDASIDRAMKETQ